MLVKRILIQLLGLFFLFNTVVFCQSSIVKVNFKKDTLRVSNNEEFDVVLKTSIKNHWHINSDNPNDELLIPTEIFSKNKKFEIVKIVYPESKEFKLPYAEKPVPVFEGDFDIIVKIKCAAEIKTGEYELPIEFSFQTCNDRTCMPPASMIKKLKVEVEGNTQHIADAQAQVIEKGDDKESHSILMALLFAFAGGIILNLMPCVLPVLSLKIMGIVQQAGEDPREKLKHGVLFTVGVLVSFWVLAGLLLLLRAGGEQLGWGFQLQSSGFVIILVVLLFLFGLSLFGVFEIGVSLTAVDQGSKNRSAYSGSFMSGVLATVVATPCTAPFMGSALGFAISQPAFVSLLIFTFLGLGMSAPYLVLTLSPKLLKFIPKPGLWMETMKQFMGFLLIATVLWLLWVLSLQTGAEGVIFVLGSLLIVSIGGWIYGRWGNLSKGKRTRVFAQIVAVFLVISGIMFSIQNVESKNDKTNSTHIQGTIEWKKFNPNIVKQLRNENKPLLIDFTAAWCLSCQVNERVAFGSEDVQRMLKDKNVVTLKADWTNNDPTITRALAKFGRNSVPLYVLYAPGKEAELLPEIITPEIVLEALEKINRSKE